MQGDVLCARMLYALYLLQSVGYIARINDETLAAIKSRRLDGAANGVANYDAAGQPFDVTAPPPIGVPNRFPLQPGTIAAHVRHGDKHLEMALVHSLKYLDAAQRLYSAAQGDIASRQAVAEASKSFNFSSAVFSSRSSDTSATFPSLQKQIFVATEDSNAIAELVLASFPINWTVSYSRIPRVNGGPMEQMHAMQARAEIYSPPRLLRAHLGQLLLALEADAWVCTYASNWCRLIDELRGVWVPKVGGPYVEVGGMDLMHYQVW